MKYIYLLCVLSLAICASCLFSGEGVIHKGQQLLMPNKFTVTLTMQATVPQSNKLSSMCQVPDFQLEQFASSKGLTVKKRAVFGAASVSCKGVGYCDNGGVAGMYGLCLGADHALIDSSCLANVQNSLIDLQAQFNQGLLDASSQTAQKFASEYVDVLRQQLLASLNAQQSVLNTTISTVELTLIQSVKDATALSTKALNETARSVATQNSAAISQLQDASNRQFASAQSQITSLASMQAADTNSLYNAIADTAILTGNRIQNLSNYVDDTVTALNKNNFNLYLNLLETNKVIQQLASSVEKVSRFELEGVDISNLLGQWGSTDKSIVFQDEPLHNYTYFSSGIFGFYTTDNKDSAQYPIANEVVGAPVYKCYEKGKSGNAPGTAQQNTDLAIRFRNCINMPATTIDNFLVKGVQGMIGQYVSLCGNREYVNNASSRYWTSISVDYYCTGDGVSLSSLWVTYYYQNTYASLNYTVGLCSTVNTVYLAPANPTSTVAYNNDGGKWFYALSRNMNLTTEVYVGGTTYTYFSNTGSAAARSMNSANAIRTVSGGTVTYSYTQQYSQRLVPVTLYGKDALVDHPDLGTVLIHRCVLTRSNTLGQQLVITDHNNRALGAVDYYGGWSTNGNPIGVTYTPINGMSQSLIELPTTDNVQSPMDPHKYYYTRDVWCCDNLSKPVFVSGNKTYCTSNSFSVCPKATFGYCGGLLTMLAGNGMCPTGNVFPTGNYREVRYKSPRIYFCSSQGKYAEPYGIPLVACETAVIELPGAGVEIQTGTISPQGLYPAACIYYSKISGNVPLYTISAQFDNQIVPTMISNLNGRKVLYSQQNGSVVDEMDRLYGIGNSGYDCMSFEMDKFLHQPRSCVNYDIPSYDMVAYFSGKVRSSGLSNMLDYFDIVPRAGKTSNTLEVDFVLKEGIDYECAYINNIGLCPKLTVSYTRLNGQQYCMLGGWSNLDTNLTVAGSKVCNGQGVCDTSKLVSDGASFDVIVDISGQQTICNRFQCKASVNSFVAYPVDTFSIDLQRPNKAAFLGSQSGYNWAAEIQTTLENINRRLSINLASLNLTDIPKSAVNSTIVVQVNAPDLTALISQIQANFTVVRNLLTNTYETLKTQAGIDTDTFKQALLESIQQRYLNASKLLAEAANNAKTPVSEESANEKQNLQQAENSASLARALAAAAIAIAAVSVTVAVFVVVCKLKLCGKKKFHKKKASVQMEEK